ncbi:hypothetical protein F5Y19DRAFT_477762 [Xylariaceae sp. FL1651]|nr:hypothetical protein F5Y19DRAFT_477762 [Xylariaceae sp. FL1651]
MHFLTTLPPAWLMFIFRQMPYILRTTITADIEVVNRQIKVQHELERVLNDTFTTQQERDATSSDNRGNTGKEDIVSRRVTNHLGPYAEHRFGRGRNVTTVVAQIGHPFILLWHHETHTEYRQSTGPSKLGENSPWFPLIVGFKNIGSIVGKLDTLHTCTRKTPYWACVDFERRFHAFQGAMATSRPEYLQYRVLVDSYDEDQGPPRKSLEEVGIDDPDLSEEQRDKMQTVQRFFKDIISDPDEVEQRRSIGVQPIANPRFLCWAKY